jgi:hypothetical protein
MCGNVVCEAPLACCLSNSRCFDPNSEPEVCPLPEGNHNANERPCASSAHCETGETCSLQASYLCQGEGHCVSVDRCGASGYAVCGCDGNSYLNVNDACRAGTSAGHFHGGACGDTVDLNADTTDEDENPLPPRWVTLCGSDAHCATGERCCGLTRTCYPESDPGRCLVPPEGTRYPCTADDQCLSTFEYCAGDGCSGPGGCDGFDDEEECGIRLEPVCGCNGVTYTSTACASAEGVRVASQGECPADE